MTGSINNNNDISAITPLSTIMHSKSTAAIATQQEQKQMNKEIGLNAKSKTFRYLDVLNASKMEETDEKEASENNANKYYTIRIDSVIDSKQANTTAKSKLIDSNNDKTNNSNASNVRNNNIEESNNSSHGNNVNVIESNAFI